MKTKSEKVREKEKLRALEAELITLWLMIYMSLGWLQNGYDRLNWFYYSPMTISETVLSMLH